MEIQYLAPNAPLDLNPSKAIDSFLELGNNAIKEGKMKESLDWYMKGLDKATEEQNEKKMTEFSGLIFTLL
jgi:hypothetical protein